MKTQQVALSKGVYRGKPALLIRFNNDLTLNTLIKNIHGVHWSEAMKCWFTPFNQAHVEAVKLVMKDKAHVQFDDEPQPEIIRLHEPEADRMTSQESDQRTFELQLKRFRYWLEQKGYRENTIRIYLRSVQLFKDLIQPRAMRKATYHDLMSYKNQLSTRKFNSKTYVAMQVSGVTKFYKIIMGTTIDQPLNLTEGVPTCVCKHEEVMHLISCASNLKHRSMLMLMYSCGLRPKELLSLKPSDIKATTNELIIRSKEVMRIVPLSNSVIHMLRLYYKQYQPGTYLFEGNTPGTPYLEVNLMHAFRKAAVKAGINEQLHLKSLRITLANYLMEQGAGLQFVLEFLGHQQAAFHPIQSQNQMRS